MLKGGEGSEVKIPASEEAGELVVQPSGLHTHTVILLHSMYCNAEMYARLYRRFGHVATGFKFVFPRAPKRQIVMPHGAEETNASWYSYISKNAEENRHDSIEAEHLAHQTARIHRILDREASLLGGDCRKLVLGGTSQGGTVAIHAAMSYGATLGALVCLRTAMLDSLTPIETSHLPMPVFVFAGEKDAVYALTLQQRTFGMLQAAGFTVEWHVEPGLTHWADSLNEQRYIAMWVARTCLGPKEGDVLRRSIVKQKPAPPRRVGARRQE
jgi:predicted esterase